MNSSTIALADQIANMVIDKSYWSNEWFLAFTILIIGLIAALCAWGGSYFTTKAQNRAMKEDFNDLLEQVKAQTNAVKRIEEDISHDYWYKKEILKIKLEKIEEAYDSLNREISEIQKNIAIAMSDLKRDVQPLSEKVNIIISLYFKDTMSNELEQYIVARNACLSYQKNILRSNLEINNQQGAMSENLSREDDATQLMKNLGLAKSQIESALQKEMRNLTTRCT